MRRLLGIAWLCLLVLCPAWALAAEPVVSALHVQSRDGVDRITLQLSQAVAFSAFTLANPDRIVIDMPAVQWQAGKGLPADYQGNVLRDIRVARFNPTTTRMVFDLALSASLREGKLRNPEGESGFQLVFEVATPAAGNVADEEWKNAAPSPGAIRSSAARPVLTQTDDWAQLAEKADAPKATPQGLPFRQIPVPQPRPEEARKPIVVIDAGHGGRDPGAIGARKTHEKNVTLTYARALGAALRATGRYKVVLTREDDTYIMLRERLAIGRRAEGDIFISIHADSAENSSTRGLSIYTLSDTASDKEAAALAARENKVDLIYGLNLSSENPDVTEILIDLAQRETKSKSIRLADTLVEHVKKTVRLLPNTHRYAGFAVLKAPDVPSVLIELGFLSNRKDEALINSPEYREAVISSLVKGIDAYFRAQRAR